jgi:hypothetical protein
LVVIDIQEKLLPPIFQKEQLVRNAQLLIRAAGILKIPALVSTQYSKGLGATVPEIVSVLPQTDPIDKTLFSCLRRREFAYGVELEIGLERMRVAGTVISSTEMMVYEPMQSSASAAFKELLPHLKG